MDRRSVAGRGRCAVRRHWRWLITRDIQPDDGPVLELGPGTGVFTKALLARGVSERDLTLIEYGSEFMRMLQFRFPQARVLWMDAAQLAATRFMPVCRSDRW